MDLYPAGRALPDFAADKGSLGEWSLDSDAGTIRRRRKVDLDTIGDLRVTFYVPK